MTQSNFGNVRAMEPHPEWVHDLAYQLWSWECSQNVAKVAATLNAGTYRDDGGYVPDDAMVVNYDEMGMVESITNPPITITRQAINGWKIRENWEDRHTTEMRDLVPAIHAKVAGNLITASLSAEEFVADFAAGRIPIPKDANEAKYLSDRLKASQDLLSRTGHLPHTRPKDDTALPGPKVNHKNAIASMSREERLARAWGEPKGTGHPLGPSMIDEGNESVIEVASSLAQPRDNRIPPASPTNRSSDP